jgi:Pyridoxamine 5'-phosphate oxidase
VSLHDPAPRSEDPTPDRPLMPPGYGVGAEPSPELLSWSWVADQLTSARNYWIASTGPDSRPHVAPVWGIWLDRAFYFSTDPTSRKGRNLAVRPNVAVHLESGDEAVMLEGRVEIGVDADLLNRFLDAYEVKYALRPDLNALNGAVYRVRPRVVLAWLERDFPRTATRFQL